MRLAHCAFLRYCTQVHEPQHNSPVFAAALREELLLTSRYLQARPIHAVSEVIDAARELSSPWCSTTLDAAYRQSVARRIALTLQKCLENPRVLLRSAQLRVQHQTISSIDEYWMRLVLSKAAASEASFPEAMRLATSDALWLARSEIHGPPSLYPLELAIIYDSIVLTGAYGVLHTVSNKPNARVLEAAGQILGHAALQADRTNP